MLSLIGKTFPWILWVRRMGTRIPRNAFMDTKRCTYCHKLVRADAHTCSRCGHTFVQKKARPTRRLWTRPSIPPASPHRAGHYSGLHPEDQPYQSSLIAIPRSPNEDLAEEEAGEWHHLQQEPEHILLPSANAQRRVELYHHFAPTVYVNHVAAPPRRRRGFVLSRGVIPVLLALSCVLFLLASGIITFVLLAKRPTLASPTLTASPGELRTGDTCQLAGTGFDANSLMLITYNRDQRILDGNGKPLEAHSDAQGAFSLLWQIPDRWSPGSYTIYANDEARKLSIPTTIVVRPDALAGIAPSLQLSTPSLDLGGGAPGTTSRQLMTLRNSGGGEVFWQASSDASWLTISPNSGTFSGNQYVAVIANRSTLKAQNYLGHIDFKQKGSTTAQQLAITMKVTPAPAAFSASAAALTFAATTNRNPDDQTIVVQNSGGQALTWSSTTSTGNGVSWLSITPQAGRLDPGRSAVVTVHAQSTLLAVGSYQGAIDFVSGTHTQVTISLSVIAPGNLVASPPELNFSTTAAQSPASKSIVLQNTGGMTLNWMLSSVVDNGNWLSATPMAGSLNAGEQATITVTIDGTALKAGSYQGQLSFNSDGITRQVTVALTMTSAPSASITVQTSALNFTTTSGTNPAAQTFSITNTGNAVLDWAETEDGNGSTFAPVSPTHGSLASGASAKLTVSPTVTGSSAGTLQTIITIFDSDVGSSVPSQRVSVTITIQSPTSITVSDTSVHFDSNTSVDQTLTVSNAGSGDLHWTTAQSSAASWLTLDTSGGTLAAGSSTALHLHCDASGLSPGTYSTSLVINNNSVTTDSQTVSIILVVH